MLRLQLRVTAQAVVAPTAGAWTEALAIVVVLARRSFRRAMTIPALAMLLATAVHAEPTPHGSSEPYSFADLFALRDQIAEIAPLQPYEARDGATLFYRRYPADAKLHLILVHGSAGHSAYLHAFAKSLSGRNAAAVYAPDLRGHGLLPLRRGDIDYISQLEDDLADLIAHIRGMTSEDARIIVGGHSSGGGLAVRFAGGSHGALAQGFVLLAPYLGHNAPMVKKDAGGWADPSILKIIGISVLNGFGIERLNGAPVLRFNLPEQYRHGYETVEYSFRLMKGMHPDNYKTSLRATQGPVLVLVGTDDEAFEAGGFAAGILPYKPDASVRLVEGVSHLGILMSEAAVDEVAAWIAALDVHRLATAAQRPSTGRK